MQYGATNGALRLTVLGTGYLGTTHAAYMASLGFDVLGVDTDARKVDQLNAGHLPIYKPELKELLLSGLGSRRLAFTTSYPEAAAFGDVHFICVGTPSQPGSDHTDWYAAGWNYRALGVALTPPPSMRLAVKRSAKGGGQRASR